MDDKTVRGDGDLISSDMNNSDATYRGNNDVISSGFNTPLVNSANMDATVRVSDDVISADVNNANAFIGSGFSPTDTTNQDIYNLNGEKYKLIKPISLTTGEAEIFLVEGKVGKAVLKLYKDRGKPKDDLIQKLRSFTHEDIIKVYDYGTIPDRFGERFFELMQYCEGGSVLDHSPMKNVKKIKDIIKETVNALDFLHKNGIYHRDIKPENLFYKNADGSDILIADFGISSIVDVRVSHHRTTKMGSDLYIAPEGLRTNSLRSSRQTVSKYMDYYSLGITVLVAWMGREKFDKMIEGIAGDDNTEDVLATWNDVKEAGKIPLPDDMPDEVKTLIKGLTVITDDKRWGHDECLRWLKGENVPVHKDILISDYKPFPFDDDKVALNPEQFAEFMQEDNALAEKYLFRGKITEWLKEAKNNKKAVLVEDIYESEYKKNKKAAVQAVIYLLNPNLPYISDDGTKCQTLEELADVIENDTKTYKQRLKSKDDSMYLFIESKGYKDVADDLRKYFKDYKDNDDLAIQYIIYSLNPQKPFRFVHPKDKSGNKETFVARDNIKLFADLFNNYMEQAKNYIYDGFIEAWLSFSDDQNAYDWIKYLREEYGNKNKDAMTVAATFALNVEEKYMACDRTECKTKEEIAAVMYKNFDKYMAILTNQTSYFHMYACVKRWDWELNFTTHCFTAKNHKNKIFPYNNKIALMKVIRALDKNIKFEIEGQYFSNPQELLKADSKVKNYLSKELKNLDSKVHAILSVYFHEDPYLQLNKKGDYEDKLKEYMDFIEQICPDNDLTKRYSKALNSLPKQIKKEKSLDIRFVVGLVISIVVPMIAGILLFNYVYPDGGTSNLPGAFWNLPKTFYIIFAILGIIVTFAGGDADFSTGCFGGAIVGAIGAIILYYIFYFIASSYLIMGGVIIAAFGYAVYAILQAADYSNKGIRAKIFDMNDKLTFEWEPLAFAFSDKDKFNSSRAALLNDYHEHRKESKLEILKISTIPTFIFFAVLVLLLSYDTRYDADFIAAKDFFVSIYHFIVNLF